MQEKIDFRKMTEDMVPLTDYNKRDRNYLNWKTKQSDLVAYRVRFPGANVDRVFVEKTKADRAIESRKDYKMAGEEKSKKPDEPTICPSELRAELAVMRKKLDVITFHTYRNHVILTKIAEELNLKIDYKE
jgi:hypothetical protein